MLNDVSKDAEFVNRFVWYIRYSGKVVWIADWYVCGRRGKLEDESDVSWEEAWSSKRSGPEEDCPSRSSIVERRGRSSEGFEDLLSFVFTGRVKNVFIPDVLEQV